MKIGKKTMAVLSFTIGACLFVTTALADIALGTGYDHLKESVKRTAAQMEEGLSSFTMEARVGMYVNEQLLSESLNTLKADTVKKASEETSVTKNIGEDPFSSYSYRDQQLTAYKYNDEEQFYVSEHVKGYDHWMHFTNPFKEEAAEDFERIIDALVGNLKDDVVVEERPEGGKQYRGSLSEVQVPALINAVLSFAVKQTMLDSGRAEAMGVPRLVDDIYVKLVSGKAVENASGMLEQATGEVVLSGADENGERHQFKLKLELSLSDIGSTVVTKPDLSDAVVQETGLKHRLTSKHIGTYRSNIVIETEDEFLKIGERTLEITKVDSEGITGRYHEAVDPAYAHMYEQTPLSFEFKTEQYDYFTVFPYTDPDGGTYYGEIDVFEPGKIHLNLNMMLDETGSIRYVDTTVRPIDPDFIRVFE